MTGTLPRTTDIRQIGENLLGALRDLKAAQADCSVVNLDATTDSLTESLVVLMREYGWYRGMALEAINTALTDNISLRDAMLATQAS